MFSKKIIFFIFLSFLTFHVKAGVNEIELSNYFINNPYASEKEIEDFAGHPHIVFVTKDNLISTLKKTMYRKDSVIKYADDRLREDVNFARAVIRDGLVSIGFFSEKIRNDDELINLSIRNIGTDIQYASEDKRNNSDLVKLAIKSNSSAIKYAGNKLKSDKKFLLEIASLNGSVCRYIDSPFNKDIEILSACLNKEPAEINNLGEWVYSNKDLVLSSIKGRSSLIYRGIKNDNLKKDVDVQREALKIATSIDEIKEVVKYMDKQNLNDTKFIYDIISNGSGGASGIIYQYTSITVKNDKIIAKEAILKSPYNLKDMNEDIINDKNFMLDLIDSDVSGLVFKSKFFPKKYIKDKEISLMAIKRNARAFFFVSEDLKSDKDFVNEAIKENPQLKLMDIGLPK